MALTDTVIGGGLFSGRAVYDSGVFAGIKEDVADFVSMISPRETPLLVEFGDPEYPAMNIWHQWQHESLGPNAIINSTAIASTTADTAIGCNTSGLQKGMIVRLPEPSGGEYGQITIVTPNTITIARAFSGTTANSVAVGQYITIVADASVDGADVLGDLSQPRPLAGNYTQIFKKDIIIAGSQEAVLQHGGVASEKDHQISRRTAEALRDLEKAIILGRLSGNTIGSSSLTRTFKGLLQFLSTNALTVTSIGLTYTATDLEFFRTQINELCKAVWIQGGIDAPLLVCGLAVKERIDALNSDRIRVPGQETAYSNVVSTYENTFGRYRAMLNRWMPTHKAMLIAPSRIKPVPLNGRSFHYEETAKTGDSEKGMVLGEYSLEVKNEEGMGQITFSSFAPTAGQRLIQAP